MEFLLMWRRLDLLDATAQLTLTGDELLHEQWPLIVCKKNVLTMRFLSEIRLETVTFCYLYMELHAMYGGWGEEVWPLTSMGSVVMTVSMERNKCDACSKACNGLWIVCLHCCSFRWLFCKWVQACIQN